VHYTSPVTLRNTYPSLLIPSAEKTATTGSPA